MTSAVPHMLLKSRYCNQVGQLSLIPVKRVFSRGLFVHLPQEATINLSPFHHFTYCRSCDGCSPYSSLFTKRLVSTKNDKEELLDPTLENVTVISPEDAKLAVDASAASETSGWTNLPGTGGKSGQKQLAIVFTCKVCNTRSAKQFTEQAYRKGVVLVRCPGCQNLHLIADRLGVFEDQGDDGQGWDIEKAMAKIGENVKAVTNDNVLELTVEDVVGADKMEAVTLKNGRNDDAFDKR